MEFEKGDFIFLKISLSKGIMPFERKGKLSPRYIKPFEILDRVGTVAYNLHAEFVHIHNVFHISMLCKYELDPSMSGL